jgi:hypothetical protein
MPTVDVLITLADRGEAAAVDALFATLYNELHRSPAANWRANTAMRRSA